MDLYDMNNELWGTFIVDSEEYIYAPINSSTLHKMYTESAFFGTGKFKIEYEEFKTVTPTQRIGIVEEMLFNRSISVADTKKLLGFPDICSGCNHTWDKYQGFSETYEFCKHCDIKR